MNDSPKALRSGGALASAEARTVAALPGILEREIRRVPRGRAVVLPRSDKARGHGTHTVAAHWKDHLVRLLDESRK